MPTILVFSIFHECEEKSPFFSEVWKNPFLMKIIIPCFVGSFCVICDVNLVFSFFLLDEPNNSNNNALNHGQSSWQAHDLWWMVCSAPRLPRVFLCGCPCEQIPSMHCLYRFSWKKGSFGLSGYEVRTHTSHLEPHNLLLGASTVLFRHSSAFINTCFERCPCRILLHLRKTTHKRIFTSLCIYNCAFRHFILVTHFWSLFECRT